ncbi:hypothetical protein N7540_008190 [Penicillium herquei]|nr:hypothetical protein N7540_008190 [Penicillium herquei]
MVWTQNQPGIYQDDLDGAEKVFYNMSKAFCHVGREHGSVYSILKIRTRDFSEITFEKRLRSAWIALRFEFPTLSVFVNEAKKTFVKANLEGVEQWADETFYIDRTGVPAAQVVSTLHLRHLPCLLFLSQTSELVFHSSHWRIDALGACIVVNRLLELLSEDVCSAPNWDKEFQNLSPSLEDAFGSPTESTISMEAVAENVRQRNFETSYPTAGLSPLDSDMSISPTISTAHAFELTREATSALIAACKSHHMSVTAAVHAACAHAVFERCQENNYDYSTIVSVNLRDQLPSPYSSKAHGCATYVTGITHTTKRGDKFLSRAAQLSGAYRGDWDVNEYMGALRPIYKVHGETLGALARSSARSPNTTATVSSVGVIDGYIKNDHGPVVVEGFHLGSAIMTRQMTLYIWTFLDKMTISLNSNEAYYAADMVNDLLDSIRVCLERELVVDLPLEKRI